MSAHVGRFIRDLIMNPYPRGASQFFHLHFTLGCFYKPNNSCIFIVVDLNVRIIGYTGWYHLFK